MIVHNWLSGISIEEKKHETEGYSRCGCLFVDRVNLIIYDLSENKPITLTFGMFAGSNWDVPNGESYKIIDEVVERFERKHPNVKVEYVSGLQKSDYSEWLSQQALKGNLPDVFMIRSNDLSTFSDIGIMQNLNSYIHKDDAFDKAAYFTPSYQSGTYQKKQYALPYESVPTLMYVNRTLLEKKVFLFHQITGRGPISMISAAG